jgi:hypothetical protein
MIFTADEYLKQMLGCLLAAFWIQGKRAAGTMVMDDWEELNTGIV